MGDDVDTGKKTDLKKVGGKIAELKARGGRKRESKQYDMTKKTPPEDCGFVFYRELTSEQKYEVEKMLLESVPVVDVVALIQNEWKKCLQKPPQALREILFDYRASLRAGRHDMMERAGVFDVEDGLKNTIDVAKEFEELILFQRERLGKWKRAEGQVNLPISGTRHDILAMAKLLEAYSNWRWDAGIDKKAPTVITGQIDAIVGDNPDGREGMVQFFVGDHVRSAMDFFNKKTIPVKEEQVSEIEVNDDNREE